MGKDVPRHHRKPEGGRVPMVLCNAGYYGTLAAVRSLGRAGVPVVTLDTGILSISRYSRHSSAYLRSPPFDSPDWADWLLAFGRTGPRRAIYATSDAVSFALADRREQLISVFDLYQPGLDTMMSILDKGLLHKHSQAVGMDTPETWLPQSASEAQKIVREVGGPLVAKPRSQLSVRTGVKGLLIDAADGQNVYDDLMRQAGRDNRFIKRFPEAAMPMLQRYYPEAMDQIYSLSGFRDVSGKHVIMRAALKILQSPRRLGIGLCFEDAHVIPALAERTLRLCERIGYYGAFELEFIASRGRMMLIDFNGRIYNQLAFDIARGMDLPRLVYAGATGRSEELLRLMQAEPRPKQTRSLIFCNSFGLSLTVAAKRAFRTMSWEEANRWREWRRRAGEDLVDAVRDDDDPLPAFVDGAEHMWRSIRHARSFLKEMTCRQLGAPSPLMPLY
jgi:D-aspartate ligase